METIRLQTWDDFASAIQSVRERYGLYPDQVALGTGNNKRNTILFRGQADAEWPLSTTLERRADERFHILKYLERALRHQSEIESLTGLRWNSPTFPELRKEVEAWSSAGSFIHLPEYRYLVYLRHHSFPSPLLDWTESPYIAAYFAYIDYIKESDKDKDRAVFCFIEKTDGSKGVKVGDPLITLHGPYVTTDTRHFAQKAWYTTCTRRNAHEKRDYFCPHEDAFAQANPTQDVLIKIILPRTDRCAALRSLSDYNINHFTLFQSEDSLVHAIASRTFDMNDG
jgi:FRG domain